MSKKEHVQHEGHSQQNSHNEDNKVGSTTAVVKHINEVEARNIAYLTEE